jgi:hypothetical protein
MRKATAVTGPVFEPDVHLTLSRETATVLRSLCGSHVFGPDEGPLGHLADIYQALVEVGIPSIDLQPDRLSNEPYMLRLTPAKITRPLGASKYVGEYGAEVASRASDTGRFRY